MNTLAVLIRVLLFAVAVITGGAALAGVAEGAEESACRDCQTEAFRPEALVWELPTFGAPGVLPVLEGFANVSTERADLQIEPTDAGVTPMALARTLDAEVVAVERAFGRSFLVRPTVYTFATAESFASALRTSFGYDAATSAALARNHGGVFDPSRSTILLNWSRVTADQALDTLRHELAHAMIHQLTGDARDLPAWLDEGLAVSLQRGGGPSQRDRTIARSLVASGQASLGSLVDADRWMRRNADLGGFAYAVAAEAVGDLLAKIGQEQLVAALEAGGRIGSVRVAFNEVAQLSLGEFQMSFDRASSKPTIVTSRQADLILWQLGGFAPGAAVTITIEGHRYQLAYAVQADSRGGYWGSFGSTAPAGSYRLTATLGDRSATATLEVSD